MTHAFSSYASKEVMLDPTEVLAHALCERLADIYVPSTAESPIRRGLAASSAVPACAQTIVDMSLPFCDQFLKSPQENKACRAHQWAVTTGP
jgi:hypothetical protein